MSKKKKIIPLFSSEKEEKLFWETKDSTEYIDWSQARNTVFPNLKPSTKTISLRLSESLFETIKMLAHKRDIPYQSLMKTFLVDKVKEELSDPVNKLLDVCE